MKILAAEDLDGLISLAAARLDRDGLLREANAGFRRLLGDAAGDWIGVDVSDLFIQPTFEDMAKAGTGHGGPAYEGRISLGAYAGGSHTLRGRVWRDDAGFDLLLEHDIDELERIGAAMHELTRHAIQARRMLGWENLALVQREAELAHDVVTDALTDVGNRRAVDQALQTEIARAERDHRPLSVIMADLDHFKDVNDRFGHAAGDLVLTHVGGLLRTETRPSDIAARLGGEEFLVIMPGAHLDQALRAAERIRLRLAQRTIPPLTVPVTASFGVGEITPGERAADLLGRVDAALYAAKAAGRNRVIAG